MRVYINTFHYYYYIITLERERYETVFGREISSYNIEIRYFCLSVKPSPLLFEL